MEINPYVKETVALLKSLYKNDMTAMSHIITAECNNDINILKEYLDCVEIFVRNLRENL